MLINAHLNLSSAIQTSIFFHWSNSHSGQQVHKAFWHQYNIWSSFDSLLFQRPNWFYITHFSAVSRSCTFVHPALSVSWLRFLPAVGLIKTISRTKQENLLYHTASSAADMLSEARSCQGLAALRRRRWKHQLPTTGTDERPTASNELPGQEFGPDRRVEVRWRDAQMRMLGGWQETKGQFWFSCSPADLWQTQPVDQDAQNAYSGI